MEVVTYASCPLGEKATSVGSPTRLKCLVTVLLEVSMMLMPHSVDVEVCGPESTTQTWLPSGVAARAWGM